MTSQYGQLGVREKLAFIPLTIRALTVGLVFFVTGPFRGETGASTLFRHVYYSVIRTFTSNTSIAQQQWACEDTSIAYEKFAKKKGFTPESTVLSEGTKAHWFGSQSAENVILFYHGGGYAIPMSPAHFEYVYDLQKKVSSGSNSFSIVALAYTVAPHAVYPKQLSQGVEMLRYLIESAGKHPSQIMIVGDSAGGNLACGVLSHLLHVHPSIPEIRLVAPLTSAILLSPWVSFDSTSPSQERNKYSDVISPVASKRWSQAFLGDSNRDNYNEASRASVSWWKDIESVVKDVLVWGGGKESKIDSIRTVGENMKAAYKSNEMIISPECAHDEMILDCVLGYGEGPGAKAVESWIRARLS